MRLAPVANLLRACALAAGLSGPAAVLANVPEQVLQELGLHLPQGGAARDIADLQTDLAWLGLFDAMIDGNYNRSTRDAVSLFLASIGKSTDGSLSADDRMILRNRAAETIRAAGFRQTAFDWTGMTLRLPENFLHRPEVFGENSTHLMMEGRGSSGLTVQLFRYNFNFTDSFPQWLDVVTETYTNEYRDFAARHQGTIGQTAFLLSRRGAQAQIDIYQTRGDQIRGIVISYDLTSEFAVQPVLHEVIGSLNLFAGDAVPVAQIPARLRDGNYPGGRDFPDWYRSMISSGSGSIVSSQGHILTNHHVVAGCGRLTVNGQAAVLQGADIRLDLALVRAPALANRVPVRFRSDGAVLGEHIFVMGFPLFDVAQSINITDGIVSSAVGLFGDQSYVQITAPVQPGNSGGPVFDPEGTQIAVVVSKPGVNFGNARNIENIAWVIRSSEAIGFMQRFGVNPLTTNRGNLSLTPPASRVSQWRQQTVRLECHES